MLNAGLIVPIQGVVPTVEAWPGSCEEASSTVAAADPESSITV